MKIYLVILFALFLEACQNPRYASFQNSTSLDQGGSPAAPLNGCGTKGLLGIDISSYQPTVNWNQFSTSLDSFIFIKATEGTTIQDPSFAGHWSAAQSANLYRGAYHFFSPSDNPTSQANLYLKTIGTLSPKDLPPVLDWEVEDQTPIATNIANAKIWLAAVEKATGRVPLLYVDLGYWEWLGNPPGFERYPLFLAQYGVTCPKIPSGWSSWTFWQTGQGSEPGLAGLVDQDLFNGNISVFLQFNGMTLPPAPFLATSL